MGNDEKTDATTFAEKHPRLNFLLGLFLILLLAAASGLTVYIAGKYTVDGIRTAVDWLASLASKLDAVVIVSLITGSVSIIGTVGGPIDVAIISKCDGFIWLKRKHYFDRAYNPQYFYSHYMLSESEDVNNGT